MGDFADKVVVVTGGAKGVGLGICDAFAREGAAVTCAARTANQVSSTRDEIEKAGGRALSVPTDVTQPDLVERMTGATVDAFGGLDILVVNAGVNTDRSEVEASDPSAWRQVLEVNLVGAYNCVQAAIPHLKARGAGKIITVGSGMGHRGLVGSSAYSCSKAGLWMLTRILAMELWEDHISVNELIPGPVATAMNPARPDGSSSLGASEWAKTPDDVVPLALFLATQPDVGPTAQSYSLMRRDA